MRIQTLTAFVLVVLVAFTVTTGMVAAQNAQQDVNQSLTDIEHFVATTLGQLGAVLFLVGAAMWFIGGRSSNRMSWGWRALWGGAGMIILSVSYNVFVNLFKSFAPGLIAPVFF